MQGMAVIHVCLTLDRPTSLLKTGYGCQDGTTYECVWVGEHMCMIRPRDSQIYKDYREGESKGC